MNNYNNNETYNTLQVGDTPEKSYNEKMNLIENKLNENILNINNYIDEIKYLGEKNKIENENLTKNESQKPQNSAQDEHTTNTTKCNSLNSLNNNIPHQEEIIEPPKKPEGKKEIEQPIPQKKEGFKSRINRGRKLGENRKPVKKDIKPNNNINDNVKQEKEMKNIENNNQNCKNNNNENDNINSDKKEKQTKNIEINNQNIKNNNENNLNNTAKIENQTNNIENNNQNNEKSKEKTINNEQILNNETTPVIEEKKDKKENFTKEIKKKGIKVSKKFPEVIIVEKPKKNVVDKIEKTDNFPEVLILEKPRKKYEDERPLNNNLNVIQTMKNDNNIETNDSNDKENIFVPNANNFNENINNNKNNIKDIDDFEKKIELALEKEKENNALEQDDNNTLNNNQKKDDPKFDSLKLLLGNEIVENLSSTKWENKKLAYELLNSFVNENPPNAYNSSDLFEYLKIKLKSFRETNFNINREAISVFISMIKKRNLSKDLIISLINAYHEKITDLKLKDSIIELINTSFDIVEPKIIIQQIINKIQKKNNVKLLNEYASLIGKIIDENDINELPIKEIINYCKIMANNSNPQVRNAATNLLCIVYKYIGNDLKPLIKDIKESTLKIIEAELEKVQVIVQDKSKIKNKKKNSIVGGGNGDIITGGNSKKINIELLSPQNISKKITGQLIKDIANGKWPEKKEAVENIEKILIEANMKIVPDGLGDLFNLIKDKLSDCNKNLVKILITLLCKLIEALKQGFKQWSKQIALTLIPNLTDKNQMIRNECQLCFDKWVEFTGVETLIIYFPNFLKNENVEMRIEIMKFIQKYNEKLPKNIAENLYKELMDGLLMCLQDRSNNVRSMAEEIIKLSLEYVPLENYYKKAKDYKPAIENSLKQILDKIEEEFANKIADEYNEDDDDIEEQEEVPGMNMNINNNKTESNNNLKTNSVNYLKTNSKISVNSDNSKKQNSNNKQLIKCALRKKKSVEINNNGNNDIDVVNDEYNIDDLDLENHFMRKSINQKKAKNHLTNNNNLVTDLTKTEEKKKSNKTKNKNNSQEKYDEENRRSPNSDKENNIFSKDNAFNRANNNQLTSNSTVLRNKKNMSVEKKRIVNNNKKNNILGKPSIIFNTVIHVNPNKQKRYELDKKYKFNLETISKDDIKNIRDISTNLFNEDFIRKIFSDDFKRQVEALKDIKTTLDKKENINIIFDNLDIILKVLGIKFNNNSNPTVIKNLLDLLDSLYNILNESKYTMNDIESLIIMSLLIEKLSMSNNNLVREQLCEVLNQYIDLLDTSKMIIMMLIIASGKSDKIKMFVLEITYELYMNKKSKVPIKNLIKVLSKYLSIPNNNIKILALNIFREIYDEIGEELWNSKDIDPKEKLFLKNNIYKDNDEYNSDDNENDYENEVDTNEYTDYNNQQKYINNNGEEEENEEEDNNEENEEDYEQNENNYNKRYDDNNIGNELYQKNDLKFQKLMNSTQTNKINNNNSLNNGGSTTMPSNNNHNSSKNINSNVNYNANNKQSTKKIVVQQKKNKIQSTILPLNNNNTNNSSHEVKKLRVEKNPKIKKPNKNLQLPKNNTDISSSINNNYSNNMKDYNLNNNISPEKGNETENNITILNSNQNNSEFQNQEGGISSEKELMEIMYNLLTDDETNRLNTIIIIHEILCSKYQENKFILIPNIDNIIRIFIQITHKLFEPDNIRNIPLKFAKYLVTILCKLTSNKELIMHISYKVLYELSIELLSYLLINGLDKIGDNQEGTIIFKSLNSAMLRVIENCDTTSVILALLELIKQNQIKEDDQTLSNLAIKCLIKTTQNIPTIIPNIQTDKILLQMHLLLVNYEKIAPNLDTKSQTDTMIIRFIKNFIVDATKIKKEKILEDYSKSIKNLPNEDKYILNWIKSTLESIGLYSNKKEEKNNNYKLSTSGKNTVNINNLGKNSQILNSTCVLKRNSEFNSRYNKSDIKKKNSGNNLRKSKENAFVSNTNRLTVGTKIGNKSGVGHQIGGAGFQLKTKSIELKRKKK